MSAHRTTTEAGAVLFEIDTLLLIGASLLALMALAVAVRPVVSRRFRPGSKGSTPVENP